MESKIIVLAGSRVQFEDYLAERGLTDSQARYAFMPEVLRGIRASEIVIIGTFFDTVDAGELSNLAMHCLR